MNKKKQNIKSSDWLIGVYSKEKLANIKEQAIKEAEAELRNKQIEEMAQDMYDALPDYEHNARDCRNAAEEMFNKGYRKQSRGVWKVTVLENSPTVFRTGAPHCSICGKQARSRTAFCPNCGAKMKGGD